MADDKRKVPRRKAARRTGRDRRTKDEKVAADKRKGSRRQAPRRDGGSRRT